ncbi:MAG TPA: glycoside hydrolase family 2 TIM barrel-domain containing protein [Vicinamibacterales bacterium]|nr:glycoside hydrolase family 2 TIM barrel-domain containing protein [Vicinamibacterales bacterium]
MRARSALPAATSSLLALTLAVTPSGQALVPRPEFPQPQFERDAWMTLNGAWEFELDDADVGMDQDWPRSSRRFTHTIAVPFAVEHPRSGIGDPSFHPVVWYRRAFSLPPDWHGRRVLLKFGAVDYRASVWVNGRFAGEHEGGHVPFGFDITPLVTRESNTIVVRAEDPPTDRFLPRGKQYWELRSESIWYTRTTGIWQSVWLEAVGESYLERVRVTPGRDGVVRFEARIARVMPGAELEATVRFQDEIVGRAAVPVAAPRAALAVAVADPQLWSPGSPRLYDVVYELRHGARLLDRVRSYFGFRWIDVAGGRVRLNGHPIYLRFVLDQGYWPESGLTPPSDEAIQYDIRMTKDMGFNGARKHQKVEDPRYLYWADRLGLLVSAEMANAQRFDATYAARFTREWMEAVERDYNHPSIIIWAPINESWGTPDLAGDARQRHHLEALVALTRSLDGTRLVIDNEGWEHTASTDLFAIHDYTATGEALYDKYRELGRAGAELPLVGPGALLPGYRYNGAPFYLSEFGGIGFVPPGRKAPEAAWGYAAVEKTRETALARLRGLYEAIARIPAFAGICYTQLTDVEQEVNGLMTYDRQPKYDPAAIRQLNALLR